MPHKPALIARIESEICDLAGYVMVAEPGDTAVDAKHSCESNREQFCELFSPMTW